MVPSCCQGIHAIHSVFLDDLKISYHPMGLEYLPIWMLDLYGIIMYSMVYLYLHDFSDFCGFHVCKYTSPIDAFLDCFSSIFSEKWTWMAWGPDHWKTWPCPTQLSLDGLSPGIICLNLAANQDESQIPNLTTGRGSLKNAFGPVVW